MKSNNQFPIIPPALDSLEYTMSYNNVKSVGGDAIKTKTIRSDNDTITGNYWAYDGAPSLCAPTRLYNQVAKKILYDKAIGRKYIKFSSCY